MNLDLSSRRMSNIDEDFGYNQLFGLNDLIDDFLNENSVICEVGSYDGVSTELFAQRCKKVYSIDRQYRNSLKNLVKKYPNIEFHQKESLQAAELFENCFFDCVYLDNSHMFEHILKEIKFWLPKVKFGGIISGHDYLSLNYVQNSIRDLRGNWTENIAKNSNIKIGFGVKSAVDLFFKNKKIYKYSDSSWAVVKRFIFML